MFLTNHDGLNNLGKGSPKEHFRPNYTEIGPVVSDKKIFLKKKGKRKVQGVPQSQTAALPRHQEEEETDKTKQAQIEQTYKKH